MTFTKVDLTQGSVEWLEWREDGMGSSDVSTLLDLNPYQTRWGLWALRFGILSNNHDANPNVRSGKTFEPIVREKLSVHFKQSLEVFCAYMNGHIHRRISLDGVIDGNVPVEIKVVSNPVWSEVNLKGVRSEAYELYYPQLCYQMGILSSPKGYLAFYNVDENRIKLFKVTLTESVELFIEEIFEAVDSFFTHNILDKQEPEKDSLRDDYIPGESEMHECHAQALEFYELVIKEREAKRIYEELKVERTAVANKLLSIASTFKSINLFGVRITNRKRSYRVDYEAFLKDKGITMTDSELVKYSKLTKASPTIAPSKANLPSLKDKVLKAKALQARLSLTI